MIWLRDKLRLHWFELLGVVVVVFYVFFAFPALLRGDSQARVDRAVLVPFEGRK